MITREIIVTSDTGIHARPASTLCKAATAHKANVILEFNGKKANAKSLIAVLALGVTKNSKVVLSVDGENEEAVCNELAELIENFRD